MYLRFLNELVVMLNRPVTGHSKAAATSASGLTDSTLSSGPESTQENHNQQSDQLDFAQNLDDPDSLWRRPPVVYGAS